MAIRRRGKSGESRFRKHVRDRILSGIAVLVPAAITFFVLSLVYGLTVGAVSAILQRVLHGVPYWAIASIAVTALLIGLYVLGFLATNVLGRRFIDAVERLVVRIPLLDSIYGTSKQIVAMFRSESGVTKRTVVLVPFPHQNARVVGFLTGSITTPDGQKMATVFVPTTPNPTTGFLQLFPEADVLATSWDTDEAIQFIMSAGLMRPPNPGESPSD
jgi:uncharacterized membrane protein